MISNNFLRMHFEHTEKILSLEHFRKLLYSNHRILIRSLNKEPPLLDQLSMEETLFITIVSAYIETYIKNTKDMPKWVFNDIFYLNKTIPCKLPTPLNSLEKDNLSKRNIFLICT